MNFIDKIEQNVLKIILSKGWILSVNVIIKALIKEAHYLKYEEINELSELSLTYLCYLLNYIMNRSFEILPILKFILNLYQFKFSSVENGSNLPGNFKWKIINNPLVENKSMAMDAIKI